MVSVGIQQSSRSDKQGMKHAGPALDSVQTCGCIYSGGAIPWRLIWMDYELVALRKILDLFGGWKFTSLMCSKKQAQLPCRQGIVT
ncbi:hypothetical protein JHK85_024785 [Glycine max]|nr:hypothetical protein JHK85_024785 [Glycine max]